MAPLDAQESSGSLRIGEAAELLEVSTDTIRRWCDAGKIRCSRTLGGQRRIQRAEIDRVRTETGDRSYGIEATEL